MKSKAASLTSNNYASQALIMSRHRYSPAYSKGFILQPTFLLLRIFYRLLVFLIIVIGFSSYWMPLVTGYKQAIEKEASSFLGTQVQIGDISYDNTKQEPRWVLHNVVLSDYDDASKTAQIKELSMTLDTVESLRTIRIQPAKIQASGVDVTLTQGSKSEFQVNGLTLPIAGFSSGAGRKKPLIIDVNNGTVRWINTVEDKQLDFYDLSFQGEITAKSIKAKIQASPPKSVGKPLKIVTELTQDEELNITQSPQASSKHWNGTVNLQGEINDPSALPINIHKFTGIIDGDLTFQLNAEVKNNLPVQLSGNLTVDKPVLEQALHTTQDLDTIYHKNIQSLAINGKWLNKDDNWKTKFSLEIEQDNIKKISNLSFNQKFTSKGFKLDAEVDQIDLDRYLPLLERQQWISKKISRTLSQLKPRGQLTDFFLTLDIDSKNTFATKVQGKGILKNISINAHNKIPALKNINAKFNFDKNTGSIEISSKNSQVDYSRWFEAPIKIGKLNTNINWEKTSKSWNFLLDNFYFTNNDAHVSGSGSLKLDKNNTPFIDLTLDFATNKKANNKSVRNYIPSLIPKGGEKWLKTAIRSGIVPKGGLKLKGNLKKFPFDKGIGGEFLTWFDVTQGELAYLPEWPEAKNVSGKVMFVNEGMAADIKSATVLGNKILSGHVSIPDFRHKPQLDITNISSSGKLSKQVKYIQQSPLGGNLKDFLKSSQFSGESTLKVDIHSPLQNGKLKKENVTVNGSINFHQAGANFKSIKQSFSKIHGTAQFNQDGFSAKKLSAQYKQQPISISALISKNKENITLSLKQSNNIKHLIDNIANPLKPYLSGKARYIATLELPSYSLKHPSKDKQIKLNIHSDLAGITSKLPEPLSKSPNAEVPLDITWLKSTKGDDLENYKIQYGSQLSVLYQNNKQLRLGIALGKSSKPELPLTGINVNGIVAQTNINDWKHLLGSDNGDSFTLPKLDVDVRINKLLLGKQSQGQAHLKLKSTNSELVATLNSERLNTSIHKKNSTWNVQLSNINFDALQDKNTSRNSIIPSQFPSINLTCLHCISKGQVFDRLKLRMTKRGQQSIINEINITGKYYQFIANGNWQKTQNNQTVTQLKIQKADIDQPGELLKSIGNDVGINNAKTNISGNLNWQGSPMDFNINSLSGNIHLNMGKGQLNDVQAGAGKLLGLLNFSKLGRRLRLDFSDVSSKGILFERISGDMAFINGVVKTDNTIIESSVMLAGIKGQSDLKHKTHDQVITVIPDVKSALPVIGLLFGGVGLGAAVAAIDKLTENNEKQQLSNESMGTRYHVTGSWSNPNITDITPVGAPEDIFSDI